MSREIRGAKMDIEGGRVREYKDFYRGAEGIWRDINWY